MPYTFAIAAVLAAGGLWFSGGGEFGRYSVRAKDQSRVGDDAVAARVHVTPVSGEPRTHFDFPREAWGRCGAGDQLTVRVWRIPVVKFERFEYTLTRAGALAHTWNEGEAPYFAGLAVAALLAGAVAAVLMSVANAVFRFSAPAQE